MKSFLMRFFLVFLVCFNASAAGRIQDADLATLAYILGAGGVISQLPNDNKIYLTNVALSEQLSTALGNGDVHSKAQPSLMGQFVTPANPAGGFDKIYFKADDKLYALNSAGTETLIGPAATPTGAPNNFAYFNALGNLASLPGWAVNTLDNIFGIDLAQTLLVPPDAGNVTNKVQHLELEINPVQNTTQYSVQALNLDTHFDRSGTGFDFNNNISNMSTNASHEGSGHVNNFDQWDANLSYGNGGAAGSADNGNFIAVGAGVGAGFSLNSYNAFAHSMNVDPAGTLSGYRSLSFSFGGDVTGNKNDILLTNTGNVTNDESVLSWGMVGDVGNNFSGINLTHTGAALNWSGITVTNNGSGATGSVEGFRAGFSNANTTAKTGISLLMGDGVSSGGGRFIEASWADGDYSNKIGFNMNGGTGDTVASEIGLNVSQSSGTSGNFTALNTTGSGTTGSYRGVIIQPSGGTATSAAGVQVTLDSISTPGVQKQGLNISDGTISAGANYDTSNLSATPGFAQIHSIGGTFIVANGFPMSASALIGSNLAINAAFNDDMGPDGFGGLLGYTNVGYLGTIQVAAGKTVDHVNMALAGASIPAGSGTVTSSAMYTAAGFIPGGGTLSIGSQTGFHALTGLCSGATNCFSLKSDDSLAQLLNVGSIQSNTSLILQDPGAGTNTVTIQSPNPLAGSYTITLPPDDGLVGQVLTTDGAGVTSWQNAPTAAFSVTTKVANYTVTNADDVILVDASAGPVTISLHNPATATGKRYSVKKIDSSINEVIIDVTTADLIDGDSTQVLGVQNASLDFIPESGTPEWFIL